MMPALAASFRKQFARGLEISVNNFVAGVSGPVTVLFGPSGAGKTTVLRTVAGLEPPDAGQIVYGNETWVDSERKVLLPVRRRGVGYVPQQYALFPHLTVRENVAYGLNSLPRSERARRAKETLSWLGVDVLSERLPAQLSGGEQQRVALARALAPRPRLLLLDEPLSALDTPTRARVRVELRQLLVSLGLPTILVTHDRVEALAFGDDILIMNEGRILQSGPVRDVFNRPADVTVAHLTGFDNVHPGRVLERSQLATVAVGECKFTALAEGLPEGVVDVYVCIRSEDISLAGAAPEHSSPRNRLRCRVNNFAAEGPMVRVELDCGLRLTAMLTRQAFNELELKPGVEIHAMIKAPHVHLISRAP